MALDGRDARADTLVDATAAVPGCTILAARADRSRVTVSPKVDDITAGSSLEIDGFGTVTSTPARDYNHAAAARRRRDGHREHSIDAVRGLATRPTDRS
jgi:hypothetical protein